MQCLADNPDGVKFCGECGAKLERVCPKCQYTNPPYFKFCGDCGHNLTLPSEPTRKELSFDEKLEKIQKYLPKGITEKILSQRDKIEGEKRLLNKAIDLFRECGADGWVTRTEKTLAEIS